ncbi:MATE family efflux transporter [candidate division KSB1 bacterium]|nr:MATE family efflux transporter [candidate division KSB1 bacterium]
MMLNSQTTNPILEGRLYKGLLQLALPAMVSMVSIMLFEFVDLMWIGRLGAEAVAALGAASWVVWAVKSIASCVTAGLNALVARNVGARNSDRMNMWASEGMVLTVLFSLLIAGSVFAISLFLFQLLGLEPNVAEMAKLYTMYICFGLPFIFAISSMDSIFRACGNTFIPMIAIVISLSLNALLDPLFIFGWLGFPKLGMPGGAVASAIAHVIGTMILMLRLPAVHIRLRWDITNFWLHSLEILRIGTPIGLLGAVFSIIYIILSKNIAYFGTIPMAAISIAHRIEGIPFFVAFGFSMAVSAYVGQNLGAGNVRRAERASYLSLGFVSAFLAVTSIIFILFGKELLGFFIDNQAVIDEGYRYLFAVSCLEIFLASEIVLEGAFTGAGDTKPPFLISIPLTFLRIPFAWYFSIHLGYGVSAIWWVISVSTFLKGILFFLWFLRGKWKTVVIG